MNLGDIHVPTEEWDWSHRVQSLYFINANWVTYVPPHKIGQCLHELNVTAEVENPEESELRIVQSDFKFAPEIDEVGLYVEAKDVLGQVTTPFPSCWRTAVSGM